MSHLESENEMSNVVDEVILKPIISMTIALMDVTSDAGMEAVEFGAALAKGVKDVLRQMHAESEQRLRLEQEWILQIRAEREKAFSNINSYITSLVKLSENDFRLLQMDSENGVKEQVQSLISKREGRAEQIRQLREKAVKCKDVDEINACANAAQKIFEGLSAELQAEMVFLARRGIELPEYGTLHDDAIKMALASRNEVSEVRFSFLEEAQHVTEEVISYEICVFENCLSEFLCEEGLNDRQLRDLMAIKQDLKRISQNVSVSLEVKKKRLATLFTTYTRREQGIRAELKEMSEYYDAYLRETFDVPNERLELADFDSSDEIVEATEKAKASRIERLKKQYVQLQMDRIMKKHGLNIVESTVMGRKEDDKRVLYGIDDSTAVDVFVSESGMLSTHVVGVDFGGVPSEADEMALLQKEHAFCNKIVEIEDDLEEVGITLRRKKTIPPQRNHNTWIQLDKSKPVQKNKIVRKKHRQTDNKVMYME